MNHVVATLKPGSRGEEVKCLNNFIVLLLDEGAALLDMQQPTLALNASQLRELITQNAEYYGPVTELLISLFQKRQRLPETGELNEETAVKLNAILDRSATPGRQMLSGISNRPSNIFWQQRIEGFRIDAYNARINAAPVIQEDVLRQATEIDSRFEIMERAEHSISAHLLRLSIKGGEYTYAKANDIVMIESSDHFTVVHVAQQPGKVKTSLRNSCLKKVLSDLPKNSFLRVNRFCAINLERISGGSYHQQCFEFDHCIKVKPRHPLAHAVFQAIGK